MKGSWSDKISHLETQIANLNRKIAEDNEELMSAHLENEKIKERFHKQVGDRFSLGLSFVAETMRIVINTFK